MEKKNKNILVVGGAGYIGSHVNLLLQEQGYNTIIYDNLSTGHTDAVKMGTLVEGDLADTERLNNLFQKQPIHAVMHFAAYTDVGESVEFPSKYYQNNVVNTLHLLDTMSRFQVNNFVFSSSAAIFGKPEANTISEEHPKNPLNPYGKSKLIAEEILRDYDQASNLRSISLRYFNAAGGDPEGQIHNYKKHEHNLIPTALRSITTPGDRLTLFGTDYPTPDGTCIRDYIHVIDLAHAHIAAMERLFQGAPTTAYNLGNGEGYSVRQVLDIVQEITGKKLHIQPGPRRPGDPPKLVANAEKARRELSWHTRYPDLPSMVAHAYQALNHGLGRSQGL